MSIHDPEQEGLPDSILQMGRGYHEPPSLPRDEIWRAVRRELQAAGLLTDGTAQSSTKSIVADLARDLLRRRVPQLSVGYLAVSWGFLQFADYIVDNFLLSPHWNQMALAIVLLLVPSVLLLAYHHGSPGKDQLLLVERIAIPANLALAVGVLFILFGGTDLGAATTSITVEDEEGNVVERVVVKEEFRKRVALFYFNVGEGLRDEDSWVSYLVPDAIQLDLAPDDFFVPVRPSPLRLLRAGYRDLRNVPLSLKMQIGRDQRAGHVLAGAVARSEAGFRITTRVHEAETGRLVTERSYEGPDILGLVDQITVELKNDLEIPTRDDVEDLPASERFSSDPAALEAYGRGYSQALLVDQDWDAAIDHLSLAVDADPTFAWAQYQLAWVLQRSNRGQESLGPMRAALDNLYRIPERLQFIIKADYYTYTQDFQRGEAVIEMWATLHPGDPIALQRLAWVQEDRGDFEAMLATLESLKELTPDDGGLLRQIALGHERLSQYGAALEALEEYTERFPDDFRGFLWLAGHYKIRGELTLEREYLERALLMEPTRLFLILRIAELDLRVGAFDEAKAGFDRAVSASVDPFDRFGSLSALSSYHEYRGELGAAVEVIERHYEDEENSARQAPIALLEQQVIDLLVYLDAGRVEEANAVVEMLVAEELQPRNEVDLHLAEAEIALWSKDPDEARSAIERAEVALAALGYSTGRQSWLAHMRGRLAEQQEDWVTALEAYRSRLVIRSRNELYRFGRLRMLGTAQVHTDIGRILQEMGQLYEAEAEIRETLRIYPSSPRGHLQLARLLVARGDTVAAVEHLEQSVAAWASADTVYEPAQEARAMLQELRR